MLKSLWLASWYPSVQSAQNGDFIQRHAQATSEFAEVHVLHVVAVDKEKMQQDFKRQLSQNGNLIEEIILYKKKSNSVFSKGVSVIRYFFLYKKYIAKNGLPDIVHVHVAMRAGILALWMKWKYKTPYVLTEHWGIFADEKKDNFNTKNFLFKSLVTKIIKGASVILPVSHSLGKNIEQLFTTYKPYVKVPNVVDTNRFFYTGKGLDTLFTFIHVSNMTDNKNPKGIINAFAELSKYYPNISLKMIGHTSEEIIVHAKKKLPNNREIFFTGIVDYKQVAKEMQHANAFILFSYSENLPCVIAESLCCGTPIITTDVGGISEMITPQNGVLVAAGNEQELANAMKNLIENYALYSRYEIAVNAQSLFNYETVGKQILNVYDSIVETHYEVI